MMKTEQRKWSDYKQLRIGRKLFTVLLLLLCGYNIFGQIYISEGTTLIVENKTSICENEVIKISQKISESHIKDDTLDLVVNVEITSTNPSIKAETKKIPKPEVKKNKTAEAPSCNFSSGSNQYFTFFKKSGNLVTVPVLIPTLSVPFQTVAWLDKDFTFFCTSASRKLLEHYKSIPLYSSSAIRPPPLEDVLTMQRS